MNPIQKQLLEPGIKLTEEQHKAFEEYVDKMMQPPRACGVCHSSKWSCSKEVFKLTAFQEGSEVTALPFCILSCGECGNTLFIDARRVFAPDQNG
jgi:hypothetical protein